MGTKEDAPAAVNANIRVSFVRYKNSVHWAGFGAITAPDALFFSYGNPAAFSLGERACGTNSGAGCGVAGEAGSGFKTCRQTAGRSDPYTGGFPREALMNKARASQGARVASDATLHTRGRQDLQGAS